jgi:cation:H+ antiporter
METTTALLFTGGLGALILGAELLVRGASRLAVAIGISPLVTGLTVVAFGTSTPELAVSARAALGGHADIALGNVVGSNIFNVLFILGVSALITPLVVSQQLVRLDVPIMIGVSVLLLILGLDGTLTRPDGVLLFAGIVAYTLFAVRQARREAAEVIAEYAKEYGRAADRAIRPIVLQAVWIVLGLGLLVAGARWLVDGAVALASHLGISDLIIGLTIVAAGTSLPEVATSIIAAIRGERDIAVGNVVGSNIYNILAIAGLSSVLAPAGIPITPAVLGFDIPVMTAVAIACLPIFFSDHCVARWEGGLFVGYYAAYVVYLLLAAVQHDGLPAFNATMLAYVLPLTAVTLLVLYVRAASQRGR